MTKVFVDGAAGTTGLRIRERLENRTDVEALFLEGEARKDPEARKKAMGESDIAILCLPDEAAREAASIAEDFPHLRIIDCSTAHRTAPGWDYGFPELSEAHLEALARSKRVANPGCHASGFIALVYPLVAAGILPKESLLSCHSLTGYSGGGKKMIAEYESAGRDPLLSAPRQYALGQGHKHLAEMTHVTGLSAAPLFSPIVADFYSGMAVFVPLHLRQLTAGAGIGDIKKVYADCYQGPIVRFAEGADEAGFYSALALSGSDRMEISVFGDGERLTLAARFDNLGKGASGAAVSCLNIMIGAAPGLGLSL